MEKLLEIQIWCGSWGALGCISIRLGKAHIMVILVCIVGLESGNPVCVVCTTQLTPSAWDLCPALGF